MIIKLAMIIVFFAVTVLVGFLAARSAKGVDGFVLGGRSVGPWLTAFSFGTSYFSAVIFIGYAGRFGWNFGLASTWVGLGNAFIGSLMAWMLLGRRTRVMTQHIGSRTMPDFFGLRYKSKALRLTAACMDNHIYFTLIHSDSNTSYRIGRKSKLCKLFLYCTGGFAGSCKVGWVYLVVKSKSITQGLYPLFFAGKTFFIESAT